jgi:MinD superfamily P-loop ATPase
MIITVASGKGGTGKTSTAVNLAVSLENVQLLDCDVEEPNAHLFLSPQIHSTEPVYSTVPLVNHELCNYCGKCAQACQYNAIFATSQKVLVFPELCHSCSGCQLVCPKNAITWEKHKIGEVKSGSGEMGVQLVYGELQIGKPLAVPIIKAVKKHINQTQTVILDSPPGTSCPFVETVRGSDFCLLVTEPTPFGFHDLTIAVQVLRTLHVPFGVVINRAGLGDNNQVSTYCKSLDIPVLLQIPYQRQIAELYSKGVPFSSELPQWKEQFRTLYNDIVRLVE